MAVIETHNICKDFKVYTSPRKRIREAITLWTAKHHQIVAALKDVNIRVEQGETVGIAGMNGSGKSTLLKIISGVATQTSGSCTVRGRISALLELGGGFDPVFTGVENIQFQCALMEIPGPEQPRIIKEICDFAQIGEADNHPVKTYSSGMYVRLAFAAAMCVEPDILIVDEALAVGDASFQSKCFRKIREFKSKGKTLLFVSHDANAVKALCDRAYLLHYGEVVADGTPDYVIKYYNNLIALKDDYAPKTDLARRSGTGKIRITRIRMLNSLGTPTDTFFVGEATKLLIDIEAFADVENPTVGISLHNRLGIELYGINNHNLNKSIGDVRVGDKKTIIYDFNLNLGIDAYTVSASCHPEDTHLIENFDWVNDAFTFRVITHPDYKFVGACLLHTGVSVTESWYR